MSTYRASVHVDAGMLNTSRPLLAPEPVGDLIESVVWQVRENGPTLLAVELVIEVAGESETPVGDGIAATSSAPLPGFDDDDEPVVSPAGSQA